MSRAGAGEGRRLTAQAAADRKRKLAALDDARRRLTEHEPAPAEAPRRSAGREPAPDTAWRLGFRAAARKPAGGEPAPPAPGDVRRHLAERDRPRLVPGEARRA
jgi:hypothetical protein